MNAIRTAAAVVLVLAVLTGCTSTAAPAAPPVVSTSASASASSGGCDPSPCGTPTTAPHATASSTTAPTSGPPLAQQLIFPIGPFGGSGDNVSTLLADAVEATGPITDSVSCDADSAANSSVQWDCTVERRDGVTGLYWVSLQGNGLYGNDALSWWVGNLQ